MVTKKKTIAAKSRKAPVKSTTKKPKSSKNVQLQSFKLATSVPFFNAKVTRQTFYWSILLLFIIIMQLIIISMSVNASIAIDNLHM